jgi:hypothetical protein
MNHQIIGQSKIDTNTTDIQVLLITNDAVEEKAVDAFQLIVNKGHQIADDNQLALIENYIYSKFRNNNQAVVGIIPTGGGTTIIVRVQPTIGFG